MSGLEVGTRLSHYEVLGEVSRGGMGIVYCARDLKLEREVALKVLPPELVADPQRRRRFTLEAKAAAQLEHPHIGVVYEADEANGVTYIAMELIRGEKLADTLAGPLLPLARTLALATEVAEGLAHAHERGIVHRDLKPGNVMLTADGHAKIIDFGLAKLVEPIKATADGDVTGSTETGAVLGTADYMSPEQTLGRKVDHRSDVFSFGVMLYQMLSRSLPFRGKTRLDTLHAILNAPAPPLKVASGEEAPDLQRILDKCLAKEPVERYQGTRDLVVDLRSARRRIETASAPAGALSAPPAHRLLLSIQHPWLAGAALLVVVAAVALSVRLGVQASRARWARNVALPEIARLAKGEQMQAAFRLARQAAQHIPDDPQLQEQIKEVTHATSIDSDPPGAQAYFADYLDPNAEWELAGTTPVKDTRVPYGNLRWKLSKEGYEDLLTTAWAGGGSLKFLLAKVGSVPAGMVLVRGGHSDWHGVRSFDVEDFWLDRYEVTNADFKRFVDAGGYEKREYWKEPFMLAGRTLTWDEAMPHFRDRTGRHAPATWTLGNFSEGEAQYPVGGVSWYEAAAYAAYAGKSLPTVYHWQLAVTLSPMFGMFSDVLRLANLGGKSPQPVGRSRSLTHYGAYDMAGNVKEWGWTAVTGRRFILGGAWNEPLYMGIELPEPTPPFDRAPTYGFRCARYAQPLPPEMLAPLEVPKPGVTQEPRPVGDEVFRAYQELYAYDRRDLVPTVDRVAEASDWRQETVTYDAGHDGERVIAHLFLPKQGTPPHQAVIYFPYGWALYLKSSQDMEMRWVSFLLASGRAVLCPVFKGTYERRGPQSETEDYYSEWTIPWAKEVGRSIDYLETRQDIDPNRIAFYGLSLGAHTGPVFAVVEKRLRTLILLGGGLFPGGLPPQMDPVNFVPRTRIPVLMVNGKDDFWLKEGTRRMFELLGTPPEQKRLALLEGGHHPARLEEVIREILDWLDRYLGPVRRS